MTEYEERALIWQKIGGSEKLHEIYHYYPNLHDARVINIECSFEKRQVDATFYYSDMIGKDANTIASTLITLCWENLIEADFSMDDNDMYHMELKFVDEKFEAVLSGS